MPFQVPLQPDQKTLMNLVVVTPRGRRGVVYTATLLRRSYRDAVPYTENRPGLTFTLFDGKFTSTQDIEAGTLAAMGLQPFDLIIRRRTNYAIEFDGYPTFLLTVSTTLLWNQTTERSCGSTMKRSSSRRQPPQPGGQRSRPSASGISQTAAQVFSRRRRSVTASGVGS